MKTKLWLAAIWVCFSAHTTADINIGVSVSATGPAASLGIPEKKTFELLPTEIAGEKVKYIVLDDATDPSVATKNARKLVSEYKVDVLIGSSSTPACAAIAEVATENKVPVIAMAPVPVPEDRESWVFRSPQHVRLMANALVAHMKSKGYKTLGFIGYSDAYGEVWLKMLKPSLQAAGIEMATVERFNRTDTSVNGQALKLVAARPDAVIVVGSGSPAALPHRTLVERGYKGQIYQTHGAANKAFLSVGGKAVEGGILPVGPLVAAEQLPDSHPSKAMALDYTKEYEQANGAGSISSFGGHAFDAYRLVASAVPAALKKAKPGTAEFRQALRDGIEGSHEVIGVHGVFNMSQTDHWGLDDRGRVLVEVQNGAFKLISNL
jgi:branched-chain amino acid transport system substrate-binding protein